MCSPRRTATQRRRSPAPSDANVRGCGRHRTDDRSRTVQAQVSVVSLGASLVFWLVALDTPHPGAGDVVGPGLTVHEPSPPPPRHAHPRWRTTPPGFPPHVAPNSRSLEGSRHSVTLRRIRTGGGVLCTVSDPGGRRRGDRRPLASRGRRRWDRWCGPVRRGPWWGAVFVTGGGASWGRASQLAGRYASRSSKLVGCLESRADGAMGEEWYLEQSEVHRRPCFPQARTGRSDLGSAHPASWLAWT